MRLLMEQACLLVPGVWHFLREGGPMSSNRGRKGYFLVPYGSEKNLKRVLNGKLSSKLAFLAYEDVHESIGERMRVVLDNVDFSEWFLIDVCVVSKARLYSRCMLLPLDEHAMFGPGGAAGKVDATRYPDLSLACQLCKSTERTLVCKRCRAARYCCKDCQIADHKTHKPVCKALERHRMNNGHI